MQNIIRFLKDDSAASAIEYGLIATGIALGIIAAVTGLGNRLQATFSAIATALN